MLIVKVLQEFSLLGVPIIMSFRYAILLFAAYNVIIKFLAAYTQ